MLANAIHSSKEIFSSSPAIMKKASSGAGGASSVELSSPANSSRISGTTASSSTASVAASSMTSRVGASTAPASIYPTTSVAASSESPDMLKSPRLSWTALVKLIIASVMKVLISVCCVVL